MVTDQIKEERTKVQKDVRRFLLEYAGGIRELWFEEYIWFYQKSREKLYGMGEEVCMILSLRSACGDDVTVQMLTSLSNALYKIYMTFAYMELCMTKAGSYLKEKISVLFLMAPETRADILKTICLIHKDQMEMLDLYYLQAREYTDAAKENCEKLIGRLDDIYVLSKAPERAFLLYGKRSLQDMVSKLNDLQENGLESHREMRPFDFVNETLNTHQVCTGIKNGKKKKEKDRS